jgi:hypothetical protein
MDDNRSRPRSPHRDGDRRRVCTRPAFSRTFVYDERAAGHFAEDGS